MANKVYTYIQERIIKQLEEQLKEMSKDPSKVFSWVKPWGTLGMPFNDQTGKFYKGINTLLLYKGGAYLSYKQIQARGYSLKPKAEKFMVVFWKPIPRKPEEEASEENEIMEDSNRSKQYNFVLRYYTVYHESDIVDFQRKHHPQEISKVALTLDEKETRASNTLTSYCEGEGIRLNISQSDAAYYIPSLDSICCPALSQYKKNFRVFKYS